MKWRLTVGDNEVRGWQSGTSLPTMLLTVGLLTASTIAVAFFLERYLSWRPVLSRETLSRLKKKPRCAEESDLDDDREGSRLTEETDGEAVARKQSEVLHFTAIAATGGLLNLVLGPCALIAGMYVAAKLPNDAPEAFTNDVTQIRSESWLSWHNYCVILGEVFTGYTIHMTVMWLMRWDSGIDTLLHHIGFIAIGLILIYYSAIPKLSVFAIAMETSTPPLYIFLVTRQLAGKDPVTGDPSPSVDHPWAGVSSTIFGVLFLIVRPVLFGYALLDFIAATAGRFRELIPMPVGVGVLVTVLFTIGWLLQLYWSRFIVAKIARMIAAPKKEDEQDAEEGGIPTFAPSSAPVHLQTAL